MTKEELEKEADKALDKRMGTYAYINRMNVQTPYTDGYKDGTEPREKRIAELERKLKIETELSNRLGLAYREYEQLTKEQDEHLAELEAQIEKMRNCHNCKKNCEGYRNCTLQNLCYWEWDNGDIH